MKEPATRGDLAAHAAATAEANLLRLRGALKEALREARTSDASLSLRKLSKRIGRNEHYLVKALSGTGKLRVDEICQVLQLVELEPGSFFLLTFPAASKSEALPGVDRGQANTGLPIEALEASLRRRVCGRSPEHWAMRARESLRHLVRSSAFTQAELSVQLGLGSPRVLSSALQDKTALTFRHIFLVLAALGVEPARFLFEVFDPDEGEVMEELSVNELLSHRDTLLRAVVDALLDDNGSGPSRSEREEK